MKKTYVAPKAEEVSLSVSEDMMVYDPSMGTTSKQVEDETD